MFIDGFSLYRNIYRSLIGFYLLITAFTNKERNRRANVMPLTLGPHSSNTDNVINAISLAIRALNEGIEIELQPSKKIIVYAITMYYISDMP